MSKIDIETVTSKLMHVAWGDALVVAKEHASNGGPLDMWLRKGDDELRKLAVAIAVDACTTLRAIYSFSECHVRCLQSLHTWP